MKKLLHNEQAFTLIEMMIVLMIISILLLITIPNMNTNYSIASDKGCEATIDLLQAQVGAYQIEFNQLPESLQVLEENNFVEKVVCPDGTELFLNSDGKVISSKDGTSVVSDNPTQTIE